MKNLVQVKQKLNEAVGEPTGDMSGLPDDGSLSVSQASPHSPGVNGHPLKRAYVNILEDYLKEAWSDIGIVDDFPALRDKALKKRIIQYFSNYGFPSRPNQADFQSKRGDQKMLYKYFASKHKLI